MIELKEKKLFKLFDKEFEVKSWQLAMGSWQDI